MSDAKYLRDHQPRADETLDVRGSFVSHRQVFQVVESFYTEVAKDEKLSLAFAHVSDWPFHFEIMTNFWWSRLGGRSYILYPYNPIGKHFENGFSADLLSRWLTLFQQALDKHLEPQAAQAWFLMAQAIGNNLLSKNNDLLRKFKPG